MRGLALLGPESLNGRARNVSGWISSLAQALAGLNGAFLAHAIAHGQDLFDMKQIWIEEAVLDTAHLLNHWPESARWALDGVFFQEAIMRQMPQQKKKCRCTHPHSDATYDRDGN